MTASICPRRVLEFGPWSSEPTPTDRWLDRASLASHDDMTPTCSHCGSLHPDVFMARIHEGWAIGGTDKAYKWYLDRPYTNEEQAQVKARFDASHIGLTLIAAGGQEAADNHFAKMVSEGLYVSDQVAKFYTAHLSRAQAKEILDLWGAGELRHTMYTRPWLPALAEDAPDWLIEGAAEPDCTCGCHAPEVAEHCNDCCQGTLCDDCRHYAGQD